MLNSFGRIAVLFFVIIPLLCCGSIVRANDYNTEIDSLKGILDSNSVHDTIRLNVMIELCSQLKSKDPEAALRYGNTAINKAKYLNYDDQTARALSIVGVVHWQMGEFGVAMNYLHEARNVHSKNDNQIGIAITLTNIGLIYSDQSHYEKALEYFFEALRIFEEYDYIRGLAPVYNNIGLVYQQQGDYGLSEEYHNLSLEIKQKIDDVKGMAFSYNNLGIINKLREDYNTAINYFQRALEIREDLEDTREMAITYTRMGNLYIITKNYSIALDYLNEALNLFEQVNEQSGIAQTWNYLGKVYKGQGNFSEAEEFFNESLRLAENIGLTRIITQNYNDLADLNADRDNYNEAYYYKDKFVDLQDSIYSEDTRRQIYEFQSMYESERKEQEIELYRQASQINALNYEKQRLLKNFLLVGVILILLLLFLLYNRYIIINKANKELEKRKNEISESNLKLLNLNKILVEQKKKVDELNQKLNQTNKKILESEKQLIEANSAKDKLFSIISHDLRNPFASIVSFSRMLKRDIDKLDKVELQELTIELEKSVANINELLENLLQWSRTQTGKIKYNPQYIDVNEIIDENISLFSPKAKEKNVLIDNKVNFNLIVWADYNMTNTVIRNLLSNALKFTNSNGKIRLYYKTNKEHVYLSVEDNGVGIDKEVQERLFNIDSLYSTFGTINEKGSGLGLIICKEFAEKQYGNITFESEEGKGSVFTFSLPLDKSN